MSGEMFLVRRRRDAPRMLVGYVPHAQGAQPRPGEAALPRLPRSIAAGFAPRIRALSHGMRMAFEGSVVQGVQREVCAGTTGTIGTGCAKALVLCCDQQSLAIIICAGVRVLIVRTKSKARALFYRLNVHRDGGGGGGAGTAPLPCKRPAGCWRVLFGCQTAKKKADVEQKMYKCGKKFICRDRTLDHWVSSPDVFQLRHTFLY